MDVIPRPEEANRSAGLAVAEHIRRDDKRLISQAWEHIQKVCAVSTSTVQKNHGMPLTGECVMGGVGTGWQTGLMYLDWMLPVVVCQCLFLKSILLQP